MFVSKIIKIIDERETIDERKAKKKKSRTRRTEAIAKG